MDAAALVVRKSGPAPLAKCLDGLSGAMKLHGPNILLQSLMQMTQTVVTAIIHDAKHVFIRNTKSQKEMVQTTKSGQMVQMELVNQLEAALLTKEERGHAYKKVVMIAYSQGYLVLRLALEDLQAQRSKMLDEAIRERLYVFTFGSLCVNWLSEPDDVLRTEHFTNEKDFVAHLGVFHDGRPKSRGYKNVFINREEGWVSRLFRAQYSLDCKHYTD
ncbi:hypothetical protein SLS58_011231 [Diplodia intermedia]|uniref:DUF676 domain-containing protein n=1 Tax=Diplodia intermedia TaxID=856260 RepID=A0ABR3T0C4_9PEZI